MKSDLIIPVLADLHCGHRSGLTPPAYQSMAGTRPGHLWHKFAKIQRECWRHYRRLARAMRPVPLLLVNADCIDGRGEKSGSVELVSVDRSEQVEMAKMCILEWQPKRVILTRGTPYHVGNEEDWEGILADQLRSEGVQVKIGDHEWVSVRGIVFDLKHHIGRSAIPHGQATPVLRDWLWNALWAESDYQPRADIIIRSHVHYHIYAGGAGGARPYLAMTTPALQAMGTRYGARMCSNLVHWGLVWFAVSPKGNWTWQSEVVHIRSQAARAFVVA